MSKKKGWFLIVIASLIWGSNGVLANYISASSMVIVFFRVIIASFGLILGILIMGQRKVLSPNGQTRPLLILGSLLAITWTCLFTSFQLIPIGIAVLLNYTAPIFVTVLAYYFLKEKITKETGLALLLSIVGISFVSGFWSYNLSLNPIGVFTGLLAGISYATFIVLAKNTLTNVSQLTLSVYTYLIAACLLFPFPLIQGIPLDSISLVFLLLLGLGNTAFAVTIYFYGLKIVKAQEAAILTYIEPLSAIIFGTLFLNQVITIDVLIGGILICTAGLIIAIQKS